MVFMIYARPHAFKAICFVTVRPFWEIFILTHDRKLARVAVILLLTVLRCVQLT